MSLRRLSDVVPRVTGKVFGRKYIMLGRLVTHWADIVGADLADKAQPVKLRYRKIPGQTAPEVGLDIACSSAEATLLHYRKDLILERINQIFGERLVSSIRFVAVAANQTTTNRVFTRKKKTLSPEDRAELSNILDKIDDPALKQRLEALGMSILSDH
jgi:hypothetical protein